MSTNESPFSTPPPATKLSKANRPSRKIILHLPSSVLSRFPSAQVPRKASRSKALTLFDTPEPSTKASEVGSPEDASELNDTFATQEGSETPGNGSTKKSSILGPKPGTGTKRNASALDDGAMPKPRGKPGPKKKLKLDEGGSTPKNPWTAVPTAANAKLGPKANQGAINAGLRALDRSGKPCRRWARKTGFQLKSFTGVVWNVRSWRAPKPSETSFEGDVKSDSSSELARPQENSSAVASEKSNSGAADSNNGAVQSAVTEASSSPAAPSSVNDTTPAPVPTIA